MKTVSINQLREILSGISHACPIGFSAFVDARARKTGNPFASVAKLSRVSAFTGMDWEASVNRQLAREDKAPAFEAAQRSWGQRISPALVENKGEFYLVAKIERTAKPVYLAKRNPASPWLPVAKSTVAAFLPVSKPANVGTDKDLIYRNYALRNLTRVAVGGVEYRIRH